MWQTLWEYFLRSEEYMQEGSFMFQKMMLLMSLLRKIKNKYDRHSWLQKQLLSAAIAALHLL